LGGGSGVESGSWSGVGVRVVMRVGDSVYCR
jgi:hypothetical protein